MKIYLVYKEDFVLVVTTLPRVVQDSFTANGTRIELWIADKRIQVFKSLVEFNKHINPRATEDDDEVMQNNTEW